MNIVGDGVRAHPCYSREASRKYGRLHVAIAPRCNVQCRYCTRRFDCANDNRPGVASKLLTPDEAVAQILTEHLTLMTGIVLAHGGTIDKFIGDAVMAFWGAPIDDPAHALHGVQAAIEMQAEMKRWRSEPGRPELHVRIGLNTGPAVVGNMGSKDRFAYTVIGDAVNLAARLEPLNRQYDTPILLSGETAAAVRGDVSLRHVDRVRVKGRTQAVELYTPENDAALVEKTEAAIALFRARDWDAAERAWRAIAELPTSDRLAAEYLGRIQKHRADGVDADWDGTLTLDHK